MKRIKSLLKINKNQIILFLLIKKTTIIKRKSKMAKVTKSFTRFNVLTTGRLWLTLISSSGVIASKNSVKGKISFVEFFRRHNHRPQYKTRIKRSLTWINFPFYSRLGIKKNNSFFRKEFQVKKEIGLIIFLNIIQLLEEREDKFRLLSTRNKWEVC